MSVWLWRTAPAHRLLVIVRPERPALVPRIERLFAGEPDPVDAFLAKPFTVDRLLNKVRERLEYRSPFSRPR